MNTTLIPIEDKMFEDDILEQGTVLATSCNLDGSWTKLSDFVMGSTMALLESAAKTQCLSETAAAVILGAFMSGYVAGQRAAFRQIEEQLMRMNPGDE